MNKKEQVLLTQANAIIVREMRNISMRGDRDIPRRQIHKAIAAAKERHAYAVERQNWPLAERQAGRIQVLTELLNGEYAD